MGGGDWDKYGKGTKEGYGMGDEWDVVDLD